MNIDYSKRLEDREQEVKEEHIKYLEEHPELQQLMSDFLADILVEKPEDVIEFAIQFFSRISGHSDPTKEDEKDP
ncbi:hypothetical protein ADUPG1_009708 [Aduncisulcus paluster]|uniref:RIIa domain-containing protein n=1 Tax=Aduncisulcus paluster TaxID=2918883 RepID=A0ABQ5KYQ3_9EUKA|nr:hypothetical protein ADUPG1_009708 [Aduncisulcus paluster]